MLEKLEEDRSAMKAQWNLKKKKAIMNSRKNKSLYKKENTIIWLCRLYVFTGIIRTVSFARL